MLIHVMKRWGERAALSVSRLGRFHSISKEHNDMVWVGELPGSVAAFRAYVIRSLIELRDFIQKDNVDSAYPADSAALKPDAFRLKQREFADFLARHEHRLYGVYERLADDDSKRLFLGLILFRLLGHDHVRLPSNDAGHRAALAAQRSLAPQPSQLAILPGADKVAHFETTFEGAPLKLDCLSINIRFSVLLGQYYLERDGVRVRPEAGDHVVDAGVCFGDTAVCFSRSVGPEGRIYGFDPLATHLEIARHNVAQNDFAANVRLYPFGLGAENRTGSPDAGPVDPGHCVSETTEIRTIDSLLADGTLPRVDFIKMDIEGQELAALEGARRTIARFKPRLAISIYHKLEDYFEIMEKIIEMNKGYDFYIGNYTIRDAETVLYGIDRSRHPGA